MTDPREAAKRGENPIAPDGEVFYTHHWGLYWGVTNSFPGNAFNAQYVIEGGKFNTWRDRGCLITCNFCGKPAKQLDKDWPHRTDNCLCEEHLKTALEGK